VGDNGRVSEVSGPVPQRIGDAERDQAAELLREHHAAGRLDQDEFEERVGKALVARTASDLAPLFDDLPGPRPGSAGAGDFVAPPWQGSTGTSSAPLSPKPAASVPATVSPAPAPAPMSTQAKVWSGIAAAAWPLTIMLCFIVGWGYWWLIFIPIALSSVAGAVKGKSSHNHHSGHRSLS
jgi:hypothetical protein